MRHTSSAPGGMLEAPEAKLRATGKGVLFNSIPFICVFLPTALIFYYLLARLNREAAAGFLVFASIIFYGWWDSRYVILLLASICGNFLLSTATVRNAGRPRIAKAFLIAALGANLGLLAYYKYTNFFIANAGALTGIAFPIQTILLPLGISFFTFTQIAFQVDTWRGLARERNFLHYLLFITYFPHLIAGPILHHAEMMPQFARADTYRFHMDRLAVGLSLFIAGLFKKTVCADSISPVAQSVFGFAALGQPLSFSTAWWGALAYAMQIYFDFSAYSDMALGISAMFGIRLPLNFDSPYRASSIIDFWRRWHMTLSRFLRDYLYIPLGGNRRSPARRHINLMTTMLLGGLWHGAAWTFVVWGGLHGLYLMLNHGWRWLARGGKTWPGMALLGWAATFLAVVVAWVFFRADSLASATIVLKGMLGLTHPQSVPYIANIQIVTLLILLALSTLAPNAYQILGQYSPSLQRPQLPARLLAWKPNIAWATALGVVAALSFSQMLSGAPSEFIYFQF